MVDLHLAATGRCPCTANHHITLRHGVDLAIHAPQRRQQQCAAAQALGVAHRGHRHVDQLSRLRERRQLRRHDHGGRVLQLRRHAGRQLDAQLLQQRLHALRRERRLRGLVSSTVQAHHQAITQQLVGPNPLDAGHFLQALGLRRQTAHQGSHPTGSRQQPGDHCPTRAKFVRSAH